jgi:hypothetical protein
MKASLFLAEKEQMCLLYESKKKTSWIACFFSDSFMIEICQPIRREAMQYCSYAIASRLSLYNFSTNA